MDEKGTVISDCPIYIETLGRSPGRGEKKIELQQNRLIR
jgi:hypothetical protein